MYYFLSLEQILFLFPKYVIIDWLVLSHHLSNFMYAPKDSTAYISNEYDLRPYFEDVILMV